MTRGLANHALIQQWKFHDQRTRLLQPNIHNNDEHQLLHYHSCGSVISSKQSNLLRVSEPGVVKVLLDGKKFLLPCLTSLPASLCSLFRTVISRFLELAFGCVRCCFPGLLNALVILRFFNSTLVVCFDIKVPHAGTLLEHLNKLVHVFNKVFHVLHDTAVHSDLVHQAPTTCFLTLVSERPRLAHHFIVS